MYICMYVCVYIQIHTYIYIYICMSAHIYIYIYACVDVELDSGSLAGVRPGYFLWGPGALEDPGNAFLAQHRGLMVKGSKALAVFGSLGSIVLDCCWVA